MAIFKFNCTIGYLNYIVNNATEALNSSNLDRTAGRLSCRESWQLPPNLSIDSRLDIAVLFDL
jgi:hypothetical protein